MIPILPIDRTVAPRSAEKLVARALVVCLELRANAGDYRDVAVRVHRVAKLRARE